MRLYAEIVFAKQGALRHLGHLDLARTMIRAVRRAGLPAAYSEGFNQHVRLTFAHALPVGVSGARELCAVYLERPVSPGEVARRLSGALPVGLRVIEVAVRQGGKGSPFADVSTAEYEARLDGDTQGVADAVARTLGSDRLVVHRETKHGSREVDIRPHIGRLQWDEPQGLLRMTVQIGEQGAAKPGEVVECVARALPVGASLQLSALHRAHLGLSGDAHAGGK